MLAKTKLKLFQYLTMIVMTSVMAISISAVDEANGTVDEPQSSVGNSSDFHSALDTYVAAEPDGYGVYELRQSNVFEPGETLILYVEPEGMTYAPVSGVNEELYNIKMSADIIISDSQGNVLFEQTDLPLMNIVSHHQNKELNLKLSLDQESPFPPGDYVIKYVVTDDNSGQRFEITKNVSISA